MLTWAIACSFSTDFSSSPRGAARGSAAGRGADSGGRVLGGVEGGADHRGHGGRARRGQRAEDELRGRERQLVAVVQLAPCAGQQAFGVDEGAVRRMQVFDRPRGAAAAHARMAPADRMQRHAYELVGRERILTVAPDHDVAVQREQPRPDLAAAEQLEIGVRAAGRRHRWCGSGYGGHWRGRCRRSVRCRFHRVIILADEGIVRIHHPAKTTAACWSSRLI